MAYALSYDKFDDPEYTLMMMGKQGKPKKQFYTKKRRLKLCGFKTTYDVNSAMMSTIGTPAVTTTTTLNSTVDDTCDVNMLKKCTRCSSVVNFNETKTCKLCERKKHLDLDAFTFNLDERNQKNEKRLTTRENRLGKCAGWYCVLACLVVLALIGVGFVLLANKSGNVSMETEVINATTLHQVTTTLGSGDEENKRSGTGSSSVGFFAPTTAAFQDASLPSDYPGDSPASETPTPSIASTVSIDYTKNTLSTKTTPTIINPVKTNDSNMEYVTPLKNSPPLHVYDKIYDEIRSGDTVSVNENVEELANTNVVHSGHFRDNTAEVFDPHPKYEINATNKKIVLELTQDMNFRPPHLRIVSVSNNISRKHDDKNPACYYTGTVRGELISHVGVSLCNGMTGYIKTSHGDYHIAPDEEYDPVKHSKTSIRHRLTKMQKSEVGNAEDQSDVHDNDEVISNPVHFEPLPDKPLKKRRFIHRSTRSVGGYEDDVVDYAYYYHHYGEDEIANSAKDQANFEKNQPYYIATMVVTDRKMSEYHKNEDDLTRYILTLMSHAALLFKDATVGNPISLVVVDIVILNNTDFTAPSSPEILRKFCEYQTKHSHKKHDVALLLTRDVICKNASVEVCTTLGVAEVGSMCNPSSSCAVVRDKGLSTSFTIAHELGHVLSMPHDDDRKCNKIYNGTTPNYIMARSLHHETQPWHWSQCSKHYLTEFLNSPRSRCLLDVPHEDHMRDNPLRPRDSLLPGEAFQADQQCELEFGPGSRICSFMPKCSSLWCTHEFDTKPGDSGCKTQYMPWADGTPCGRNMWCLQGQCTSKNHFKPVHGGWGKFEPRGNCTRPCGGGIQMSVRECNNPTPAHGGSYCMGPSHHYKSCNVHRCPKHTPDFRETQCAQFNGNSKGLHGLDHNVRWVPKYGTNIEDACKLYCRVDLSSSYYLLENKVLDGTKCGLNSFDICVNGVCMKGGCDNRLASNVTLDDCGVCGGNNKECCKSVGFYNKTNYGYNHVIRIPKGSSNIIIKQGALADSDSDENYLSLKDPPEGRGPKAYHLNGNSVISGYTKDIIYGGLTFKYSGSNISEESIVTPPKAKLTKDIMVEVLQVGNVTYPNIEWSYTISCKDTPNYSWEYYEDKWTDCNSICRGYRYPLRKCKDLVENVEVNPQYCENQNNDKPKACNTHCELEWRVVQKGPCSSYCGPGWRSLTHECIEIDVSSKKQRVIDPQHCRGIKAPPTRERCEGACEAIRWQYGEWEFCTKSCGGGHQERRAVCVNDKGEVLDDHYCAQQEKHVTQTCGETICPSWLFHDWSSCSVTCGTGMRRRQVSCMLGNRVMPNQLCAPHRPPIEVEECTEAPCYDPMWMHGDWNDCSGDCGDTYQKRLVTCMDTETGTKIIEEHCTAKLGTKPQDKRRCDLPQCIYEWVPSPWGKCSKSCGEGEQTRQVLCIRKDNKNPENDQYCEGLSIEKPPTTRKCNITHCPPQHKMDMNKIRHAQSRSYQSNLIGDDMHYNQVDYARQWSYHWVVHKHSTTECSTACGTGYRNRTVSCIGTSPDGENFTFTDARCEHLRRKPPTSIVCKRYDCAHAWLESNWSPCSVSCGVGIRHRQVTCNMVQRYPHLHFIPTDSNKCALVGRPHFEERCSEMDCSDPFKWKKGEWQKCRSQCKDEKQFRRVYCVDRRNNRVPNWKCAQLRRNKPRRRRKCGNRSCSDARSCKELQRIKNESRNNDYWLRIGNKRAKIYCYKMDTDNPEEFITLLDGESNFSEVYARNGYHGHSCPADTSSSMQRTKFWKFRLDIHRMIIIADDFTHSRSRSDQIPLGTAADCFGNYGRSCIKGQFKIDLSRTSFRFSSDISWIPYGQSPRKLIKTSNTTITGLCGGNCGGCKFNPSIGLKVEIT